MGVRTPGPPPAAAAAAADVKIACNHCTAPIAFVNSDELIRLLFITAYGHDEVTSINCLVTDSSQLYYLLQHLSLSVKAGSH